MKKEMLIQSVERAFDILEIIAAEDQPVRSIDIAKKMGLNANTVNNLLRTLSKRGYLAQNESRHYKLGPQCAMLAFSTDKWDWLRECSTGIMNSLAETTGDLAFLGVMEQGKLICVSIANGSGSIVVSQKQAWTDKPHCSATGKVLLAALSGNQQERILERVDLKRFTDKTITDKKMLLEQLLEIKAKRYAFSRDEVADGISAAAVPITDSEGSVIASLGSSFPSYFVDCGKIKLDERIEKLNDYASQLSKLISKGS